MKNLNKKSAALLIAVAVLALATVGGTLAYLIDSTDPVTNTFTPSTVDTEIVEEFDGSVKSSIVISNAKKSVNVYVRVALVGNWVNSEGEIVEKWTPPEFTPGTNWVKHDDGFYYYTLPLAPDSSTTNLLGSSSITASITDGKTLEVTVIQQSIQAEPSSVVQKTWGVTITKGAVTDYTAQ